MISTFDTNVLVYSTQSATAPKAARARELLLRGMRSGTSMLLLQTLSEFSSVTIRKMGMPANDVSIVIDAWRAVMSVQAAVSDDLSVALTAVTKDHLSFWDAMLWATAHRIGVRYLLTEDLQDGRLLGGVRFVNPFDVANNQLVDEAFQSHR